MSCHKQLSNKTYGIAARAKRTLHLVSRVPDCHKETYESNFMQIFALGSVADLQANTHIASRDTTFYSVPKTKIIFTSWGTNLVLRATSSIDPEETI